LAERRERIFLLTVRTAAIVPRYRDSRQREKICGDGLVCRWGVFSYLRPDAASLGLLAVDKQLNEDSGNQNTDKSQERPEHILLDKSKPEYKDAQKTHHRSEKGSQFHSEISGGRATLDDGRLATRSALRKL
jgi:hypothetical protein